MSFSTELPNTYNDIIHAWKHNSIVESIISLGGIPVITSTVSNWPSGSLAIYVPFSLQRIMNVAALYWINGNNITGTVDGGVFSSDGVKLFSTGPVLMSGVSSAQINVFSPPPVLTPGLYYVGMSASLAGANFLGTGPNNFSTGTLMKVLGMAQSTASHPLPSNPTMITINNDFIPSLGISSDAGM